MRIGIAGTGRVGCSLALALAEKGVRTDVYSRRPEAAAGIFSGKGVALQGNIPGLVEKSDVIFVTVPDSEIAPFSAHIAGLCGGGAAGKIFLHCSGALTSAALKELEALGAATGSLHPIQTFPDRESSWKAAYGIYFGFEGSDGAMPAACETVRLLDGRLLLIAPEAKPLYHAAACMLSNYMTALSHAAGALLERAGIPQDAGMKAFGPLLRSTADNIIAAGSAKALTGPISRGDTATVLGHLAAIGADDSGTDELYRVLGRLTVRLARLKGSIDDVQAASLYEALR
jgi:predicted short-subunit dehydrogenase-like oxidoreductase (DUF2520 family)